MLLFSTNDLCNSGHGVCCVCVFLMTLFERSEFLIATSKKKINLCASSTNLGFTGEKMCASVRQFLVLVLRQYDTTYVLCTRYVCTWYQPAEIYTCVRGGTHDTYVPPVDAHV